jgi:hypothetical protein
VSFRDDIVISDISPRLFVVPIGTTLHVPDGHEWYIMGIAVLPTRGYAPPLGAGEVRDARAWGDLQIRIDDAAHASFRANVLTLIDRYWGRFNLNPMLPGLTAKFAAAQQAMYTAPKLSEMYTLMGHLDVAYQQYIDAAAPRLDKPMQLNGGARFTIEHVACEDATVTEMLTDSELGSRPIKVTRALDVELSTFIKRVIS